jgi:hypothetical protein
MANRQVGVLWSKRSANGTQYLSGTVSMGVFGECAVVVFKTAEKRSESSPDWIIYASTPQRQNGMAPAPSAQSETADPDDEIPF